MSQEYNVSEMRTMCENYVQRVHDANQASGNSIDTKKEYLIFKMAKGDLEKMTNNTNCAGVFGILALDDNGGYDTQSVLLVPFDSAEKAIPLGPGTEIKGIEEHIQKPPRMYDIIHPNGGSNVDIAQGVKDALLSIGI